MAKKAQVAVDEKLESQDIDLFETLMAIDKKDYAYFDRLSTEQKKKIVPFMLVQWASAVKGSKEMQSYYLQSVEYHANKYLLDYMIASKEHDHAKLQWLMLCAASPGVGKQFHQYIPKIRDKVSFLLESPTKKEIKEYFKKIYPKCSDNDLSLVSETYVDNHARRKYLADKFPSMKFDDIELLSDLITDEDINKTEEDYGN
jgi:hypothetical protein